MMSLQRLTTARLRSPASLSFRGNGIRGLSSSVPLVIGIRREDPSRIWERRVPFTPQHVKQFLNRKYLDERAGVPLEFHVQTCSRRIFPDTEYVEAGAKITDDLSKAHIIIGIKEPKLEEVLIDPLPWPGSKEDGSGPLCARTYMMFSHTAKGQEYNMPLLDRFLSDSNSKSASHLPTLIDYELLADDLGKRTLAFGHHAGLAGTLLSLHTLAQYQLSKFGVATPFLYTPLPQSMPKLDDLRKSLKTVGDKIAAEGTGQPLGPCVIGVTGSGNVAQGCLSMLLELPLEEVDVHELEDLVLRRSLRGQPASLNKVYLIHAKPQDYLVRASDSSSNNGSYSRDDYYANPTQYASVFSTRIAPYLTLLLNGIGWAPGFPRLMSNEGLRECARHVKEMHKEAEGRFGCVGDISCDPYGGLEFLTHSTTLDDPYYKVQLPSSVDSNFEVSHELWVQAVDILPASLPFDASNHFSHGLRDYLQTVVRGYVTRAELLDVNSSVSEVQNHLRRAIIASSGHLVGRFGEGGKDEWLGGKVRKYRLDRDSAARVNAMAAAAARPQTESAGWKSQVSSLAQRHSAFGSRFASDSDSGLSRGMASLSSHHPKRVLLLGSGMVAGPAVRHIAKRKDVELVVASKEEKELKKLQDENANGIGNVRFHQVDVGDVTKMNKGGEIRELVKGVDVIISLLPVALHVRIAELCIQEGKHLVTASYISPEMKELNEQALAANVLLLNEIGLDPGIDHCSAISILERLKSSGRQVKSFVSFCGGLPAPELLERNDNNGYPSAGPLSYKFSWSPRGVLTAALNGARYRLRGEEVVVSGPGIKSISALNSDPQSGGGELLKSGFPAVEFGEVDGLGAIAGLLEGLPNRDSLPYADMYGLSNGPEKIRTVLRGTLRYKGFSSLMSFFHDLGMLEMGATITPSSDSDLTSSSHDDKVKALERAWFDVFLKSAHLRQSEYPSAAVALPELAINGTSDSENVRALRWLLSAHTGTPIPTSNNEKWVGLPALPSVPMVPLDLFTLILAHKLRYAPGERDMVAMVHEVTTSGAADEEEIHTSSLLIYGSEFNGQYESAMARSVGIPVAIAALAVLDGAVAPVSSQAREVTIRGVQGPGHESIRERVLEGMEQAGIGMREGMRRVKLPKANSVNDRAQGRRSVENTLVFQQP